MLRAQQLEQQSPIPFTTSRYQHRGLEQRAWRHGSCCHLRELLGRGSLVSERTHFASVNELDVTRAITTWRSKSIISRAWRIFERDYTKNNFPERPYEAVAGDTHQLSGKPCGQSMSEAYLSMRWYVSPKLSIEQSSIWRHLGALNANRQALMRKTQETQAYQVPFDSSALLGIRPLIRS